MRSIVMVTAALLIGLSFAPGTLLAVGFTRDFRLEECTWANQGSKNPYFILKPGRKLFYEGEDEEGAEISLRITVKKKTETITFESAGGEQVTVEARIVEEREWEDGELIEVSRNWFARCKETSDTYYFGEDVDIYEDGEIVSHDGAWRAGVDGAQPGIIMPGTYLLGAQYLQEVAPEVAMDRARHIEMNLSVSVQAGEFDDCVAVKETSPLDAGAKSFKIYCPGVGLVIDDVAELVRIGD